MQGFEAFAHALIHTFEARVHTFEARVNAVEARVNAVEAPIQLAHAPVDLVETTAHLIEAIIDPVEALFQPLVGPALGHGRHDRTVTRCLHAVARKTSRFCNGNPARMRRTAGWDTRSD